VTTGDDSLLSELRDQLRFVPRDPVDFDRDDPETTAVKVRVLTAAATSFNILAVARFGGRSVPARQEGLVEQVVAATFQTFAGEEAHPSPFDKAAMLLRGITQGHPFVDGNKRTGFVTALSYLDLMGYELNPE